MRGFSGGIRAFRLQLLSSTNFCLRSQTGHRLGGGMRSGLLPRTGGLGVLEFSPLSSSLQETRNFSQFRQGRDTKKKNWRSTQATFPFDRKPLQLPPVGARLKKFAKVWSSQCKDPWVVSTVCFRHFWTFLDHPPRDLFVPTKLPTSQKRRLCKDIFAYYRRSKR